MEEITIYDRFLLEAMHVVRAGPKDFPFEANINSLPSTEEIARAHAEQARKLADAMMAVRQASLEEPGENDITIESIGLSEYASALLMVKPPVAKTPMARHAIKRMRDVLREFKDDMIRNFPSKPVASATQTKADGSRTSSNDPGAGRSTKAEDRVQGHDLGGRSVPLGQPGGGDRDAADNGVGAQHVQRGGGREDLPVGGPGGGEEGDDGRLQPAAEAGEGGPIANDGRHPDGAGA